MKTKQDFSDLPTGKPQPVQDTKQPPQPKPAVPVSEWLEGFKNSLGDGSRKYLGLETGLAVFDDFTGGIERFMLIAGTAGVGKTTLCVQLALGVIRKENIPVLYYSYEMSRDDLLTTCLQNIASGGLTRRDILASGNNPLLARDKKLSLAQAFDDMQAKYEKQLYIYDAGTRAPSLDDLLLDIKAVIAKHDGKKPLVVLDSVQDLIPTRGRSETGAEAETAQRLQAIQQETGVTLLGIAQKNKSGWGETDSYESVLGSVSWMHKPTAVLNLTSQLESLKKQLKNAKTQTERGEVQRYIDAYKKRKDTDASTLIITSTKGRNFSKKEGIRLDYYGAYRFFEPCNKPYLSQEETNGEV